jgi:hypothetical protein
VSDGRNRASVATRDPDALDRRLFA